MKLVHFDGRAISGLISQENNAHDPDAFTSGGVRYLPREALKRFAAIRVAAHAAMLRLGTRFAGAYLVGPANEAAALSVLAEKAAEWEAAKQELLAQYEQLVAAWVEKHPDVAEFASRFPSIDWVRERITFDYMDMTIAGGERLQRQLGQLPRQILEEVSEDIANSWNPSAQRITARTVGILRRAAQKMESLAFLGGDLARIANAIRGAIAGLPSEAPYSATESAMVSMMLATLSNPDTALDILKQVRTGETQPRIVMEMTVEDDASPAAVEAVAVAPVDAEPVTEKAVAAQACDDDGFAISFA